jgi:hypothetical protein
MIKTRNIGIYWTNSRRGMPFDKDVVLAYIRGSQTFIAYPPPHKIFHDRHAPLHPNKFK